MIITGDGWSRVVKIDGVRLDEKPSQKLFNHSPDGFNWGYGGSGPAQLALALCLHLTGQSVNAVRIHQEFKRQFIMGLKSGQDFEIDGADMMRWIQERLDITARN